MRFTSSLERLRIGRLRRGCTAAFGAALVAFGPTFPTHALAQENPGYESGGGSTHKPFGPKATPAVS